MIEAMTTGRHDGRPLRASRWRGSSRRRAVLSVLAALGVSACGDSAPPPESDTSASPASSPETERPTPPLYNGDPDSWLSTGYAQQVHWAVGLTSDQLTERFGSPASTEREPFPNRHTQGQIDTLVTYRYPDMEVQYYVVSDGGEELISMVRLDDAVGLSSVAFEVGLEADSLRHMFPDPDATTDSSLIFRDDWSSLELGVREGEVVWLVLSTFPD